MSETATEPQEKAAVALANAGLAPFLILTLLSFFQIGTGFILQAMVLYSLAIIAFLGGSWWGFALMMREVDSKTRVRILIASNVVVLAGTAVVLLLPSPTAVFGLAALYVVIVFFERRLTGLTGEPDYYKAMRLRVSMIAAGAHLLFGWAISAI